MVLLVLEGIERSQPRVHIPESADFEGVAPCRIESPETKSSLFSRITFSWLDPLILLGNKKILSNKDVWNMDEGDCTKHVHQIYLEIRSTKFFKDRPMAALFYTIRSPLIRQLNASAIVGFLSIASPFWLSKILGWLQQDSSTRNNMSIWLYLLGMFCTDLARTVFEGQQYFYGSRTGLQARCILIAEIYEKSLRRLPLSDGPSKPKVDVDSDGGEDDKEQKSIEDISIGKIVTLMSADTDRIRHYICYLHEFFVHLPVAIICSLSFLVLVMGWSALIGVAALFALLPAGHLLGKMVSKFEMEELLATDKRVNLINEVLQGIRIVKFFAWESRFIERITKIRLTQLKWYAKKVFLYMVMAGLALSSSTIVTVVTFVFYTLVFKNNLTAVRAFTSLKLLKQTAFFIGQLPDRVMLLIQAKVSWDRIRDFLDQEVHEKYETLLDSSDTDAVEGDGSSSITNPSTISQQEEIDQKIVRMERAWFTYHTNSIESTPRTIEIESGFQLRDIDVVFPNGLLSVICGPTGSGKTTLLLSLLGETKLLCGRTYMPKSRMSLSEDLDSSAVAYAAQSPWLLNATVRENICFGLPFVRKRYSEVLRACALVKDLEGFPGGDMTMIGDKGITLSGGQKQRVCLARAAYSRAGIVLLDDPLSAVDAPTAQHLFKHCILGVMRNRTRLLVTHAVPLVLPRADFILVMNSGTVVGQGTPTDLEGNERAAEILRREGWIALSAVSTSSPNMIDPSEDNFEMNEAGDMDQILDRTTFKPLNEESRDVGSVSKQVYKFYFDGMGGFILLGVYMITYLLFILSDVGNTAWLATWTNAPGNSTASLTSVQVTDRLQPLCSNTSVTTLFRFPPMVTVTGSTQSILATGLPPLIYGTVFELTQNTDSAHGTCSPISQIPYKSDEIQTLAEGEIEEVHLSEQYETGNYFPLSTFMIVYCTLGLATMVFDNLNYAVLIYGVYRASRAIHKRLLEGVLFAPMRFFEITPIGRILNRLSKDIQLVDNIQWILIPFLRNGFAIVVNLLLMAYFLPSFLLAIPIIAWVYVYIAQSYLNASRELKRLESVSRSPVYALFSETLAGVTTIRAYGQERRFAIENETKTDENHRLWFFLWTANRWLAFRTNFISALLVVIAASVLVSSNISAGWAGLVLTYSLEITGLLLGFVLSSAEAEIAMNSVERLREYATIDPEEGSLKCSPPESWPTNGDVSFIQLSVRYSPDLPFVLNNITLDIRGGHKIGVVGRTGAGKSTLALSLLRMVPFDPVQDSELGAIGSILIDGIDISTIKLSELRSRLTIIPQDPVLFSGTLRQALDPLEEANEESIKGALERVQFQRTMQQKHHLLPENISNIKTSIEAVSEIDLAYPISENGSNLSQGQRQLVCIARALLRKSRIVVLDEATASVDNETDALIQRTLREGMNGSTIITIAHRLHTIIDYDRVIVLQNGQVVEYDTPYNLMSRSDVGCFRRMCEETGDYDALKAIAEQKQDN
ncbi:P-loop containing nucleoside triphosphate hydrolase protein [Cladochytrium replicatum]|nr:P-loop containing nucleoside triphosphate hydrolase protein [Cladochytrium replicatum]